MLGWICGSLALTYSAGTLYGWLARGLTTGPYPSPDDAEREMAELAQRRPEICAGEEIGRSTEGRPIHAFRLRGVHAGEPAAPRPQLLVTAHIHAVEYIGSFVARALARRLVDGYERIESITTLLDGADVWMVPLLNPDGAARIWRRGGWGRLGRARFTATGVDPNRNFPFVPTAGRAGWNSGSTTPGSPYYRGPQPLSEPECLALARLCARQRFCAAINFHSFGGVVFMPQVLGPDADKAARVLAVFRDTFPSRQRHVRYRPISERSAKVIGQLDPFLLHAFGTPSVTIEVSRLGAHVLAPWRTFNIFWWANPARPERWVDNDAAAAIDALLALRDRSGGTPCIPAHPELAEQVPR